MTTRGRAEACDDCGHRSPSHRYIQGVCICTQCYGEREAVARTGEGPRWEKRTSGLPPVPGWRAYHLACAEVGYSLRTAPDRQTRERIHQRWSHYMYLSAVLRDEDGFRDHRGLQTFEGPEWERARAWVESCNPTELAYITGGV